MPEAPSSTRASARIGVVSGLTVAGASILFSIAALLVEGHVLTMPWDVFAPLVPSLVLAPAFVALVVAIHSSAAEGVKPWTRAALAFATIYAPLVSTAYVVEMFVVEPAVLSGQADRVALLTLTREGWGGGVLNAVDGLGYLFQSLACLFAAAAFREPTRLSRWIRAMLLATFAMAVPIALTYFVSGRFVWLALPWGITVPALGALLAVHFRRAAAAVADGAPPPRPPRPRRLDWLVSLSFVAVLTLTYVALLHPWMMRWGATDHEITRPLSGDELAPPPYFTRAITIHAPPSVVWPWIVQIGQDRGGFYSNTWLENLVTADIHNANRIHPEWQRRALGDRAPLARRGLVDFIGVAATVPIVGLEPERMIAHLPGRFVLEPRGAHETRLIFRESYAQQGPTLTRWLAWDPMHFVMVQRMMRGIKERAEGHPLVPAGFQGIAWAGWLAAAVAVLAPIVTNRRARRWLIVPLAYVALVLATTHDAAAALAATVAVGLPIAGGFALGRGFWPRYLVMVACVMIVLVTAPDAFAAFGLLFATGAVAIAVVELTRNTGVVRRRQHGG
jgi:hypothetical protein